MSLSQADLDAIRSIVREELRAVLDRQSVFAIGHDLATDRSDDNDLMGELASSTLALLRKEPGAEERHVKADARYRLAEDDSYVRRARKLHGKGPNDPLSLEEMEQAIRIWRHRNKGTAEKARRTREAKRKSK